MALYFLLKGQNVEGAVSICLLQSHSIMRVMPYVQKFMRNHCAGFLAAQTAESSSPLKTKEKIIVTSTFMGQNIQYHMMHEAFSSVGRYMHRDERKGAGGGEEMLLQNDAKGLEMLETGVLHYYAEKNKNKIQSKEQEIQLEWVWPLLATDDLIKQN